MATLMVCLGCSVFAQAQTTLSKEKIIADLKPDSSYYLGNWVKSSSIIVLQKGDTLRSNHWAFDEVSGVFSVTGQYWEEFRIGQRLLIRFEIYPFTLPRNYRLRNAIELDSTFFDDPNSTSYSLPLQTEPTSYNSSDLRQSGSLSRGIIVGSNQDFALESGLNFELSGQLTDDIKINASLTDQSIPIQPDGTTQNLREFDKVFIQLEAPNAELEMGDVDISYDQSIFARLNRRLQGAAASLNSNKGNYKGAASVVRGTYKSIRFDGQEGVQGPYRLTGRNEQDFVIILAGTERVYVNGQEVQRGAENDYIIDYGLGELTFTNNLLVKDETRITVEYEYVDQDFNRTLVAAEGGEQFYDGRLSIGATVIRQSDGDDLLSQQSLTRGDIDLLKEAGDELDGARVSGARIATEEEKDQYVQYARIDTVFNGNIYTIYKHDPGLPDLIYRVQFSKVEEGEGAYRRTSGKVNGLLFEWVGPGLGDYSPFRRLPAPEQQQMVALNSSYNISDQIEIFGEWAVSDFDANRFSTLDDGDNTDMAYEAGLRVQQVPTALGEMDARVSRRYSGRNFKFFERTREVEFDRKWNISRLGESKEAINEIEVGLSPTEKSRIGGEFGLVERNSFTGIRQASNLNSREEGLVDLSYQQDWVQSDDELLQQNGSWFRQQGSISKTMGSSEISFTPYFSFEQEDRMQKSTQTDSLSALSQAFYDVGPGMRLVVGDIELDGSVAFREEKGVINNVLADEAHAIEQRYKMNYQPGPFFGTRNEVRVRNKEFTKAFEQQGSRNRKGLLLKSITNYATSGGFLDGEFYYEANTRRQALLQEAYIEVGPEIGQYIWDDLNGDGIQQVDEFFREVSPNEGIYLRQFLPSDELLPVIDLNTRLLNTFQPFSFLQDDHWASAITLRSRIDLRENSTTQDLDDIYFLKLAAFRNDSTTLRGQLLWEKELDLLKGVEKADLSIGYAESRGLNKRSTESIATFTNRTYLNMGYEINPQVLMTVNAQGSSNRSISSNLLNRNFDIQSWNIKPGINATINRSWNTGLQISYAIKKDRYQIEPVSASLLKISTTQRTYLWRKLQANIRLEVRNTKVKGKSSTYGNYELTEGTGEGINLIWSLNNSFRASNLIRFSFNYDGRTVSGRSAVHIMKLVMSATF